MFLFEMSKNIGFRNIDRSLWLAVSSMCSRNKDTEAEFVKPYGTTKNDMNDQIQRYVAALLIMKKPCPKTEKDIDKLKTYKLIGHHAIELGATIEDIQSCYDINSGKSTSKAAEKPAKKAEEPKKAEVKDTPAVPKVERAKRGKIQLKYMDKLNAMIAHVTPAMYQKVPKGYEWGYSLETNVIYQATKADIEDYIKTAVKKSHQNIGEFAKYIQNDFSNFYKIIPHDQSEYLSISFSCGDARRGWDTYYKTFVFKINPDSYDMYVNYRAASFSSNREWNESTKDDDLLKGDMTKYVSRHANFSYGEKPKTINLMNEFDKYIFNYIVVPMIKVKATEQMNANKGNSGVTLAKYHMDNVPANYFDWLCKNITVVLKNNPDTFVPVNYGDWSGQVKGFEYNTKQNEYFISVYMQSNHSDMEDEDYLRSLTRLSSNGTYSYKYRDEYETYSCTVEDLEELAEKAYNSIKKLIEAGKLS